MAFYLFIFSPYQSLNSTFQVTYYGAPDSNKIVYSFTDDAGSDVDNKILVNPGECKDEPIFIKLVLTRVSYRQNSSIGFNDTYEVDHSGFITTSGGFNGVDPVAA